MIFTGINNATKKITPIFKEMMWTWGGSEVPPDEGEIKQAFERLFNKVVNGKSTYVSCGRLYCERVIDTKEVVLGLEQESLDEWANR